MMQFGDIFSFLTKMGYIDREPKEHHRVFYEFDKLDFLYNDCVKKFEMDYYDGKVEKIIMTQYFFGKTIFKDIYTLEELYESI